MGRPLSPLELKEMAERLPSKSARKAPRKTARAKASTKRAARASSEAQQVEHSAFQRAAMRAK